MSAQKKDYQTLSFELDEVLTSLQAADIQVDEALTLYDKGLKIIAQLEKHLENAEHTIEELKLAAQKEM